MKFNIYNFAMQELCCEIPNKTVTIINIKDISGKDNKFNRIFHYTGTLEHNVELCRKELEKLNKDLPMHKYLAEKFDKEYKSKLRRKEELEAFIRNAPRWIEERDKKGEEE